MLTNNPYWKQADRYRAKYNRAKTTAPFKVVVDSLLSTGSGIGAGELFAHHKILPAIGATAFALWNVRNGYRSAQEGILDSHIAGLDEGGLISKGTALEEELAEALSPQDLHEGYRQLQAIWRDDPSYRGGQLPQGTVK